jgi:hypothetical protein
VKPFSVRRFTALLRKEWLQMRRDAITLRFIIVLPMMRLFLFGYAINTDPKHLPAGLLSVGHSKYERTLAAALRNSGYYNISLLSSEAEAERSLAQGKLLFVINIPPNFDRSVDRGETPSILVDADATDPTVIGNATAALAALSTALDRDLPPIRQPAATTPPFQFVLHARYNPEQLTVLEWVAAMGLRTKRLPDSVYRREREPGRLGHGTRAPMRRIGMVSRSRGSWIDSIQNLRDLASVAEKRGERGASFLRPQRGGK